MFGTLVTAVEISILLKFYLGVVTVGIVWMLYLKLRIIVLGEGHDKWLPYRKRITQGMRAVMIVMAIIALIQIVIISVFLSKQEWPTVYDTAANE